MIRKTILSLAFLTSISAIGFSSPTENLQKQDILTDSQIDHFIPQGRWIGPQWWANRLQDWSAIGPKNHEILCAPSRPFLPWRLAHDMIRDIDLTKGNLNLSVTLHMAPKGNSHAPLAPDSMAGLIIGTGHNLSDPMARAMIFGMQAPKGKKLPAIPGSGIACVLSGDGYINIIDLDRGKKLARAKTTPSPKTTITVTSQTSANKTTITVSAPGAKATATLPTSRIKGGVALASHPGTRIKKQYASLETTFSHYSPQSGFSRHNDRAVGPIVSAQYTVDRGILKLTAQCMPQPKGTKASIAFYKDHQWQNAATTTTIHPVDQLALFRIENWDSSKSLPYRVSIPLAGSDKPATFTGTITAEPHNGKVRLALLGGILHRPWGKATNWKENLDFPHHDIQQRVLALKPDAFFFYGDQIYEGTPSGIDHNNYYEDYLYKWLFHCMAFRETLRNIPTATVPDDHDVFQGNYWGEGGREAPHHNQDYGGYVYPAPFVAMVHRTQTGNLPDAYDPHCLQRNIPAYHCDWNWGGVSFAILGDRYFKSGPAGHGLPKSGTNRPDHYNNPNFDTADLDLPGLQLLGKPQEKFLAHWAADWSHGTQLKALLSQSPFANLATHHAGTYLIADLDSNGWPQSGRNRALRILRSCRSIHIAGDQHLATLVQHGIDNFEDSIYSFAGPSVANAYARAFFPANHGNYYKSNPPKPSDYLGNRLDGFKNKVTFHGCANPDTTPNSPYRTADHPRRDTQVPGFGIIDFDTKAHTITFDCKPRSAEVSSRFKNGSYPGWPLTIKASQNDGRKPIGELARVELKGTTPVVRVWGPDGKLEWAQRMSSNTFTIPAYAPGKHKIEIGTGENGKWHTFESTPSQQGQNIKLTLP